MRNCKVRYIKQTIEEFIGEKINMKNESAAAQLGRSFLYKFALERRIEAVVISEVLKCGRQTPARERTKLTRSFAIDPEKKQKWNHFNLFIQEAIIEKEIIDL